MGKIFLNADEVAEKLGVAKSTAYAVIKECNAELKKAGYITLAGKVPKAYFAEKCYGYQMNE